ncbi:MAG: hypothetical protein RQ824_00605 [bacterium]|nr:hypothetical protein [bacterium]
MKTASVLILINALLLLRHLVGASIWMKGGITLFSFGLIIIVTAIWVSIYTRFEGNFVRDEGASFSAFKSDYIKETLFMPRLGALPQVGFTFHKISVQANDELTKLVKLSADVSHAGRTVDGIVERTIDSENLLISDWTLISFVDFGYSTRLVLHDFTEKEIEKQKIYMKLFPAGAEERAEGMYLGYSFYIKLYPDYIDNDGMPGTRSLYPENPMLNLRIVRNKDIVFDGLVEPGGKVKFDNIIVQFPEVKMCVEMRFVRDYGLPIVAVSIPFFFIAISMLLLGRKRARMA